MFAKVYDQKATTRGSRARSFFDLKYFLDIFGVPQDGLLVVVVQHQVQQQSAGSVNLALPVRHLQVQLALPFLVCVVVQLQRQVLALELVARPTLQRILIRLRQTLPPSAFSESDEIGDEDHHHEASVELKLLVVANRGQDLSEGVVVVEDSSGTGAPQVVVAERVHQLEVKVVLSQLASNLCQVLFLGNHG